MLVARSLRTPPRLGRSSVSRPAWWGMCRGCAVRAQHHKADAVGWEAVIGLEIHAQIISNTKIFSGAAVQFAAEPNTLVDFLDAGLPGTLPVLNARCVEAAVLTGLALGSTINRRSTFDRKHYFYFDLPLGFQITQHKAPIVEGGSLSTSSTESRSVRIERLHLEQDTGKSFHTSDKHTLVDLNRAGTGLMEIVTYPDIRSADEAALFVRKLQALLQEIGTCSGQMAEGSLRVDANVSVRRAGSDALGTRVEIKNVNGTRHLKKAIDYEVKRQIETLESGGEVAMETRKFAWQKGVTHALRNKETGKDYRFMPEPDLPPLILEEEYIESLRAQLPELPHDKAERLVVEYGVSPAESAILVDMPGLSRLFEHVATPVTGSSAAKWLLSDFLGALNAHDLELADSPVTATQLSGLLQMMADEKISNKSARDTLNIMLGGDVRSARDIVEEKNWIQLDDKVDLRAMCDSVIAEQSNMVEQYRSGKEAVFKALLGNVLKKSGGMQRVLASEAT